MQTANFQFFGLSLIAHCAESVTVVKVCRSAGKWFDKIPLLGGHKMLERTRNYLSSDGSHGTMGDFSDFGKLEWLI